jgi:hypothetical protein
MAVVFPWRSQFACWLHGGLVRRSHGPTVAQPPHPNPNHPHPPPRQLDFGANPIERQLLLSAQFLQKELPVRLAHRVAELENLPYGLSSKPQVLKVGVDLLCACVLGACVLLVW